jgi:hypothetical protein
MAGESSRALSIVRRRRRGSSTSSDTMCVLGRLYQMMMADEIRHEVIRICPLAPDRSPPRQIGEHLLVC